MLMTTVGMRTEWDKLMERLTDGVEDESPLQVKLNGVATIIGKIGLAFTVLTFMALTVRFLGEKVHHHELTKWFSSDALTLLNYFVTTVTILIVAVPEGLPLAVTLSLAFAMKKLMDKRALVRHLSECETMGSATCICTDKTGTLTTNQMAVNNLWICEKTKKMQTHGGGDAITLNVSENALAFLLQAIFHNSGVEAVKDKDRKKSILGTPTESAILEYGVLLGGDIDKQRRDSKLLKVEPFNSEKKRMSLLIALPDGNIRAFCKGASKIILKMCDKFIDVKGEIVHLTEKKLKNIMGVINEFTGEALRALCFAFKNIDDGYKKDSIPNSGYTLVAVVGIKDPVCPGVKKAVKTCLATGITVRRVTGNNINTAKAIAKECGILTADGLTIEGPELCNKSPEELRRIIPRIQVIARSSPMDKLVLVKNLRGC